ncbi:uncharacterized protein LOC131228768 [Magnolia sinica]|uniref:uncharacterized protein LOC131228768 n=1 Tax=Magnolia sinica TaxID=86752 RepID=UPI0026589A2E|nr:uncharacterized protein LOC131228768 [Magnolia sinica]
MPKTGFDVILGMDWLAEYSVVLNCAARRVTFHIPGLSVFQFIAEPRVEPLSSFMVSNIEDFVVESIEQLPVVCEYLDVFQEIPSLPPHQQQFALGSPVLFVKKKDGSLRLVDYHELNRVTIEN